MYGWMSIFILMLFVSLLFSTNAGLESPIVLFVRVVFGVLLFLSAMTFVLRRRA